MNDLTKQLNEMLENDELIESLTVLPPIKRDIKSKSEKLLAILDIYKIFIPNKYTVDIYNRLYFSVVSSLEKKNTINEVEILNKNFQAIKNTKHYGVSGGLDSFKITGSAGLGKTSSIHRCADIIFNHVIKTKAPIREIIPILFVECVSDGSFKSLLYSILEEVDKHLSTSYFRANKHQTTTVDTLLAAVSNVLTNHVALLVIDEVERMANDSKKGETLINYLTQLVNQSNISICFVGNESSNSYFEKKEYLARRTVGISIQKMNYDEQFFRFLKILFSYQYTNKHTSLTGEIAQTIFKLSNGIPAIIVSLFVETQRNAILNDEDCISSQSFITTFKLYFANLLPFINQSEFVKQRCKHNKGNDEVIKKQFDSNDDLFKEVSLLAKKDLNIAIDYLQKYISVEFVQ